MDAIPDHFWKMTARNRAASGELANTLRIRLVFEDENMLNNRQRSEGLEQCWMIVKPHLKTVADLVVDILCTFHLKQTCPHGLLLSMDGFTLPPSQPTCILKDNDIVSLYKKREPSEDIQIHAGTNSIEGVVTLEGQNLPGLSGVNLLAIDEFEKETGGYQSESEEDGKDSEFEGGGWMEKLSIAKESSRKKRKKPEQVQRLKGNNAEADYQGNSSHVAAEVGDDEFIHKKQKKRKHSKEKWSNSGEVQNNTRASKIKELNVEDDDDLQLKERKEVSNKKIKDKKEKHLKTAMEDDDMEDDGDLHLKGQKQVANKKIKDKKAKHLKTAKESEKIPQDDHMVDRSSERENGHVQGTFHTSENVSTPIEGKEKSSSRSARRKKAKRHWLLEHIKAKNEEFIQNNGTLDEKQLLLKSGKFQKSSQEDDGEAEEESLPIVVRPGHIRFEPLDEDQENQGMPNYTPMLHWNGITKKRQGQNWGKEKNSIHRQKDPACSREVECFLPSHGEQESLNECPLNFDNLPSITGLTQEGDVIAYRLVELSSSWCPELSSFRVGKVASYDSQSSKVILAPVSEHPIVFKDSYLDADQTDISLYNEDGSLEIDFAALVDIRWVYQHASTNEANHTEDKKQDWRADMTAEVPVVEEPGTGAPYAKEEGTSRTNQLNTETLPVRAEGDKENTSVWQEINQAFKAKKEELSLKKDQFKIVDTEGKTARRISKKPRSKHTEGTDQLSEQGSGSNSQWSFKALRSTALGPTMSLLRAQKML